MIIYKCNVKNTSHTVPIKQKPLILPFVLYFVTNDTNQWT